MESTSATHLEQVQQLFVRHAGLLQSHILGICGDVILAEDILQEVFLVVTKRAETFVLGSDFLAWARAIARLKTLEQLRARGRERTMLTTEALDAVEAVAPDLDTWHAHQQALQVCLAKLPPAQQKLTALAYAEDLTPAQIAERSGKAANVVHVLMSRLRRVLRECVLARLGFAS